MEKQRRWRAMRFTVIEYLIGTAALARCSLRPWNHERFQPFLLLMEEAVETAGCFFARGFTGLKPRC